MFVSGFDRSYVFTKAFRGYVGGAYFTPHRGNNRPEWIEDDMIVD